MMQGKLVVLLCFVLVMAGCTSTPVAIEYYIFNPPPGLDAPISTAENKPQVLVIEPIELSSYLRQSGLVFQTAPNRLIVSNTHLWAEKLDNAVPKALVNDFQRLSGDYAYYLKGYDWVPEDHYRLRLRIDNLQPMTTGEVIVSGRFQVAYSRGDLPPLTKNFSFRRDLEEGGYGHAVNQMELLLEQVAETILQEMTEYFSPKGSL